MADEFFALSKTPPAPAALADADYDALCVAVMATGRGRWFLEEYARRNRHTDTERLLGAIARLEGVVRTNQSDITGGSVRGDLIDMARTIAQARAEVADVAPDQAAADRAQVTNGTEDILAAAERLQEVAWTLREHGIDMATCDQIETLTKTLTAASVQRDTGGERAHRLAAALAQLDQRIEAMLESGGTAVTALALAGDPGAAGPNSHAGHAGSGPDTSKANALPPPGKPVSQDRMARDPTPRDPTPPDPRLLEIEPEPADFLLGPVMTTVGPVVAMGAADRQPSPSEPPSQSLPAPCVPVEEQAPASIAAPASEVAVAAQPGAPAASATTTVVASTARAIPWLVPPPTDDPSAALSAMSDEERIAIFT